jgi:hypothetical protein
MTTKEAYKRVLIPTFQWFPALEWIEVDGELWTSCTNLRPIFTAAGRASRDYMRITTSAPPTGVRRALLVTKNMKNARAKRVISITQFPELLLTLKGNSAHWERGVGSGAIEAYARYVSQFAKKPKLRVTVKRSTASVPEPESATYNSSLDAITDRVKEMVKEEAKEIAINRFRASEEFAKVKQHMIEEFQAKLDQECREQAEQARKDTQEAIKNAVELHLQDRRAALESELRSTVIKSLSRRKDIQEAARFIALEDQRQKYSLGNGSVSASSWHSDAPALVTPPKVTAKSLLDQK